MKTLKKRKKSKAKIKEPKFYPAVEILERNGDMGDLRFVAFDGGSTNKIAEFADKSNADLFAAAKGFVNEPGTPHTITIPVTFTMIMGKDWDTGGISMAWPGSTMSIRGEPIGTASADIGCNPYLGMYGGFFHADIQEMFKALYRAIDEKSLPKQNPAPRKPVSLKR